MTLKNKKLLTPILMAAIALAHSISLNAMRSIWSFEKNTFLIYPNQKTLIVPKEIKKAWNCPSTRDISGNKLLSHKHIFWEMIQTITTADIKNACSNSIVKNKSYKALFLEQLKTKN
ncbi:hypothetical protein KAH94_04160 [bacterium]|nr:hypothetical protein [bacterium]